MPSPFPGMDPYLESPAIWPEVHQSLITYTRDALQSFLRSTNYRARINERVILLGEQKVRTMYPDVSVSLTENFTQARINEKETPVDKATIAMVEADKPVVVIEPTEIVEPFLEIRLARSGTLVTVIEILSLVNKTTGSPMYREKQKNILIHGINLVEIDLLRDDAHVLAVSREEIANLPGDYWVCVSRTASLGEYEIYPISIRKRLPRISIPLRPSDPDVVLDLQSVFDLCYDNSDFAREIDYNATPEIPLSPDDARWADALLREKGRFKIISFFGLYKDLIGMPTIAFITLGCKVNQYDTQLMREVAKQNGYEVVSESESADIYVINTCTVTHTSDRKARQTIRKTIREHPDAKILVTGCYADSDSERIEEIEGVTSVLGNNEKKRLVEYLRNLDKSGDNSSRMSSPPVGPHLNQNVPYQPFYGGITTLDGQTRALVKIQDGCNTFCTYCIVPYVRGRMTSRPIDDIVREVETLAQNGYKEVVITGVHLGAYGEDINDSPNLGLRLGLSSPKGAYRNQHEVAYRNPKRIETIADVLERIHPINGIERIRLSSIEPMDVPDDLIERIAQLPKVAPHFHLPLQSGNNEILKKMGRRYTAEEYARLVGKLRATFPDVGITTDIMVGFPSETDAQFNDTYSFIKEMAFSRLHVFRYSPRKGTPAASYPGRIPPDISAARSEAVRELGNQLAGEFHLKMLGRVMEVLVEESREGKDKLLAGFTGNYIRVLMDVPDAMINRIIRVRLIELEDGFVKGMLSG